MFSAVCLSQVSTKYITYNDSIVFKIEYYLDGVLFYKEDSITAKWVYDGNDILHLRGDTIYYKNTLSGNDMVTSYLENGEWVEVFYSETVEVSTPMYDTEDNCVHITQSNGTVQVVSDLPIDFLRVYSIKGKLLKAYNVNNTYFSFMMRTSGMYIVQFDLPHTITKKLIVN